LQGKLVLDERPHRFQAADGIHREPKVEVHVVHLGERASDPAGPRFLPRLTALLGGRHPSSLASVEALRRWIEQAQGSLERV